MLAFSEGTRPKSAVVFVGARHIFLVSDLAILIKLLTTGHYLLLSQLVYRLGRMLDLGASQYSSILVLYCLILYSFQVLLDIALERRLF